MEDWAVMTPEMAREAGLEAIQKAESARLRAEKRRDQIERDARRHLQIRAHAMLPWWKRVRTSYHSIVVDEHLVDVVTNSWCGEDPRWNGAVSDNRWYLAQAAAFGANG